MVSSGEHELEAQRVLLRSLDDLEAERAAGNIDDATYARLHGDYTARAAAVLRALDGEPVELPAGPAAGERRPPRARGRRADRLRDRGRRHPRDHDRAATPGPDRHRRVATGPKADAALKAAVRDHPDDYSARIEYARSLLGTDRVGALQQYGAAARLGPKEPEPPTYIGWILGLASSQVDDAATRSQCARTLAE